MASVYNVVLRTRSILLAFTSSIFLVFLDSDGAILARMKYRFTSAQEMNSYQNPLNIFHNKFRRPELLSKYFY
ncbi:hypothetical protein HanIR_Chr03g0141501 [Helianthus annuus]|nr:hypothetical protein HanIR_Chr03g0141501 [Helianthus annuus]